MNYLILEDEQWAAERLASLISEIRPEWNSLGVKDSVKSAKTFLKQQAVDLIFVDINLGDGLSFSIFQDITAQCPLIFTTAYDQYAIKAFKLNSIDYLLKPISKEELSAAINKFESLNSSAVSDWQKLIKDLKNSYKERFFGKHGRAFKND